jgi:hypothetical protein
VNRNWGSNHVRPVLFKQTNKQKRTRLGHAGKQRNKKIKTKTTELLYVCKRRKKTQLQRRGKPAWTGATPVTFWIAFFYKKRKSGLQTKKNRTRTLQNKSEQKLVKKKKEWK